MELPVEAQEGDPTAPIPEVEDIGFTKDRTFVTFTRGARDGLDRVTIESPTLPGKAFQEARQALVALALTLLEIPPRSANTVDVRGVAFKRNKEGAPGCVIKVFRYYSAHSGGHSLNTPVCYLDDENPAQRFSPDQWAIIERIQSEAAAWANGKTDVQADLFAPPRDEASDDATADLASQPTGGDGADLDPAFDDGGEALAKVKRKTKG